LVVFVMRRLQRAPQQYRDDQREHDHLLVLARQNEAKLSISPISTAPAAASG
jgi:hypothetical protein